MIYILRILNHSSVLFECYICIIFLEPGAPLNLTASPLTIHDKLSLNVSWLPPKGGNACIGYYRVLLHTELDGIQHDAAAETNNTNVVVQDLYACASYLVTVNSIDQFGEEGSKKETHSKPTQGKGLLR